MDIGEFLDGQELTGKHAAIVFSLWLGLVVIGAFVLTFMV